MRDSVFSQRESVAPAATAHAVGTAPAAAEAGQSAADAGGSASPFNSLDLEEDDLDVPAFLRRHGFKDDH
jgi:hypothetical protein